MLESNESSWCEVREIGDPAAPRRYVKLVTCGDRTVRIDAEASPLIGPPPEDVLTDELYDWLESGE
jgi:hypothetical protein